MASIPASALPPRILTDEEFAEVLRNAPEVDDDEELSPETEAVLLEALEDKRAGRARPSISDEELCERLGLR